MKKVLRSQGKNKEAKLSCQPPWVLPPEETTINILVDIFLYVTTQIHTQVVSPCVLFVALSSVCIWIPAGVSKFRLQLQSFLPTSFT